MFNTFVAWIAKGLLALCLLPVVTMVNCEGLRNIAPVLGAKIYKVPLPFLYRLANYEGLHRLDLAFIIAIFLLFATCYSTLQAMRYLIMNEIALPESVRPNKVMYEKVVLTLSWVILALDLITFYCGIVHQGWGTGFSVSAVILTIAYGACLTFFSFLVVQVDLNATK